MKTGKLDAAKISIPTRSDSETFSYRHVRPFPPHYPSYMRLGLEYSKSKDEAWIDEFMRRRAVQFQWDYRRATRAARPPKGHDHPEWV